MTRIMLAAFFALAATPASAAERRYTVIGFDRIQVEGPFEVVLSTGRSTSARAIGSAAAIDRLSVEVQGTTLRVRPNRSAWGGNPGEAAGPVRLEVATHELRGASLSGAGSLSIDKARAMRFDATLSGSGQMRIGSLEADAAVIGLLGSGKIAVGGKAKSLRARLQGSGDFDAEALAAEDVEISAETAGRVALNARRTASVTSGGQGDVIVGGSPACTVKQLGSGQVLCGKSNQR